MSNNEPRSSPNPVPPAGIEPSKESNTQREDVKGTIKEEPKKTAGEKIRETTEHVEDKIRGTFKNIKESKQVNDLYRYARTNKEQMLTYILLAIGVILLFTHTPIGGLLIGLVTGYFFSDEIVFFGKNIRQFFESQDYLRYLVMIVAGLALLVEAPGIIIGVIVAAAFTYIIGSRSNEEIDVPPSNKTPKSGDHPR